MTRNRDPEALDGRELVDAVTADSERAEQGLRRGNILVAVVGVVFVLVVAAGAVVINRIYPPASPPNTATQQELSNLRADLDQYLSGRGGLRDAQYAKTVYTLCVLAADVGDTDVLNDPEYRCAQLLAAPPPSTTSTPPAVTGSASPSATGRASPSTGGTPTARTSPTSSRTAAAPAPSTATTSTTPTPTPGTALIPGVLCALPTLPVLPLCPGGTT